jgi:hypothetical protein
MARKSHTNTAKPCQIAPKLPFAVGPYHDLLTPAQERAVVALLDAHSIAAAACQAGIPELERKVGHEPVGPSFACRHQTQPPGKPPAPLSR